MFPKCPDLKCRGFTPVGEIPADDQPSKEVNIPKEAKVDDLSDDDLSRPSLPKRELDNDRDIDHNGSNNVPGTNLPVAPPAPLPAPEQGGENASIRRSGHTQEAPVCPGNAYGEKRTPTEITWDIEHQTYWKKTVEGWSRSRSQPKSRQNEPVPGPGSQLNPTTHSDDDAPLDDEHAPESEDSEVVLKLAQEGGVRFMNFLLAKAVPPHDELPNPSNIRDWTLRDILRLPAAQQKEWKTACHEELDSLHKRKIFELYELPPGCKAVENQWVFDIKSDGRKKARLVAKGFSQVEGVDYDEIFSPVVRFETVRMMLATAALENWYISVLDVKTAFLYGQLDKEIYMEQPDGFKLKGQECKVLRLRRAIYGLKQAALAWWKELDQSIQKLGFKRLYADAGLFVCRHMDGTLLVMITYVDDILFIGPNKSFIASKKAMFMELWKCRDLGDCKKFLRMHIERRDGNIYLDQTIYLQKVLQQFGMTNARYAATPLPAGYKPLESTEPADSNLCSKFQSVIGSLLYIMLGTRPDIAYAVTKMSQFAANPSCEHLDKALYICRYLAGMLTMRLSMTVLQIKDLLHIQIPIGHRIPLNVDL